MWRRFIGCFWFGEIGPAFRLLAVSLATLLPTVASAGVELVGHYDDRQGYQDVWGYDAPDGTALALVGTQSGDLFVDVTDPSAPTEIAFVPGGECNWRDIKTRGSYAYSVKDCPSDDCLRIYDLAEPLVPRLIYSSSEFFRRSHNIYIEGDRLYATGTFRGLVVLDISDPENPTKLGVLDEPYLHDIYVRDGIGYGAAFFEEILILLDVSDPTNITALSRRPYEGAATHNTWLTEDGQHCVTTDEVGAGHLHVFDVSDSSFPFEVSEFVNPRDPESIVHNVQIKDDLAYTSWYTSGLLIVSLQTPALPQEVGSYDTFPSAGRSFNGAWGAYPFADSGLIYVSDRQGGLYILRYTPSHGDWTLSVRSSDTGEPLDDVRISFPLSSLETETALGVTPTLLLQAGAHPFEASRFGFETTVGTVEVVADEVEVHEVVLVPLPSGRVSGTIEAKGALLERARVSIFETPLEVHPDSKGHFEFPGVPVGSYRLRTELFGFGRQDSEIEIELGSASVLQPQLRSSRFADDLELESGWTVGSVSDDATDGIWVRVDPNGTGGVSNPVQPEDDASVFGEFAFVTGNAARGGNVGENDVDGGVTTLFSPVLDLSGVENPVLQFRRWFYSSDSPDAGDFLEVAGSTDGGGTWLVLSRVDSSEGSWQRMEIPLRLYFAGVSGIQLRFVAGDRGLATVVEAAIDDIEIFDAGNVAIPYPDEGDESSTAQILSPRPHPMTGESLLRFQSPGPMQIRLDVYDVMGRRVRSLGRVSLPAGSSWLGFDGRGDDGSRLHTGVYFLRMTTPDGMRSRAVRILR